VGAIAKGWKISFNVKGIPLVNPAYANAEKGEPHDEI